MPERIPFLCRLRLHRWRQSATPWLKSCRRCGKLVNTEA